MTGRFCVAWSHHIWIRGEALQVDRYCSTCGLIEPRPRDRPDPQFCNHLWENGTFRRRCQKCGTIDRSTVLAPSRAKTPPFQRSHVWRGKVRTCWVRDGEGCFYCRGPLDLDAARLDHFIPKSKGGADGLDNRRAACKPCDVRKRDRMPWEFMPERFAPPDPDAVGSPDPALQRPLNPPELVDDKSTDEAEAAA
jgi:5-methylcytosine-specific restriction endonuclease McrA